jgi:hypothetical protein
LAAEVKSHYKEFSLRNKFNKSKFRRIRAPDLALKDIQRRIKNNILSQVPLGEGVHGGVRGHSPSSNATPHLGQRCVVKLDVKDFFPSVSHTTVYRMFKHELGFGRDVSSLLTRLTTIDGQLPQGAPTSTVIANLVLARAVDKPVRAAAEVLSVRYSRFVDDITLSGANPRPLINLVGKALSRRRLPMYREKARFQAQAKLRILGRGVAQEVTGLVVNARKGLSVGRKRRDKVRAAILALGQLTDEKAMANALVSIRGRIGHVRRFNPGAADRLDRYLKTVIAFRG